MTVKLMSERTLRKILLIDDLPDEKLARVAYALKDKTRRRIFWTLSMKSCSLSELLKELGLSKEHKPLLCYHLRILKNAGLVETVRERYLEADLRTKKYRLTNFGESLVYFIYRAPSIKKTTSFKLMSKILSKDYRIYSLYKATVALSTVIFMIVAGIITATLGNLTVKGDVFIFKVRPLVLYLASITLPAIILTITFAIIFRVRRLRRTFGF